MPGRRREVGGRAGSEAHSTPYYDNHVWLAHFRCNRKGLTRRGSGKEARKSRGDCIARTGG